MPHVTRPDGIIRFEPWGMPDPLDTIDMTLRLGPVIAALPATSIRPLARQILNELRADGFSVEKIGTPLATRARAGDALSSSPPDDPVRRRSEARYPPDAGSAACTAPPDVPVPPIPASGGDPVRCVSLDRVPPRPASFHCFADKPGGADP